MAFNHSFRAGIQIARSRVIAKPSPGAKDVIKTGRGKCIDCRPPRQKPSVVRADSFHRCLLKHGARNQIATLEQRIAEAKRDRAELENAPQVFAEKRRALSAEVQAAEGSRRECADRLQTAEMALAAADRDARAALEAASAAREELARTEERFEGAKRRLSDIGREIRDMPMCRPFGAACSTRLVTVI